MKVYANKNSINLSQNDFVASGGQASVYKKGNVAYKIYTDQSNSIPIGKIRELSVLDRQEIVAPQEIITNSKQEYIGYTMPFVNKGVPICKLFVRSYLKQLNFSNQELTDIILNSKKTLDFIHSKDILVVDLNEMNLLLDTDKQKIFFIDTDSYQTKGYPATFLMENIRDWTVGTNWNENSDWFSWGVLTYQIFTGIHPYGGNHKSYSTLKDRMKQFVSVYNPEVKFPKVFKDKSLIPQVFDDWYKAIFEDGKRCQPPSSAIASAKIQTINISLSTQKLEIKEICCLPSDIVNLRHDENNRIVLSTKEKEYSTLEKELGLISKEKEAFYYKGTRYKRINDSIFKEISIGNLQSSKKITACMPNSTHIFDGIVIQEAADTYIFNIFPTEKTSYTLFLKDLKGYKILDAKFESKLIILLVANAGKYYKIIYSLDDSYQINKRREVLLSTPISISFGVLDNGVCAHILEDEILELFSERDIEKIKIIKDPMISSNMKLFADFNVIYFAQNQRLYRLKTK